MAAKSFDLLLMVDSHRINYEALFQAIKQRIDGEESNY